MDKNFKILEKLHLLLAKELTDKITSGEAKAGDLNVARQFLKDNGVECLPVEKKPYARTDGELTRPRCCTCSGVIIMSKTRNSLKITNGSVIFTKPLLRFGKKNKNKYRKLQQQQKQINPMEYNKQAYGAKYT